MDKNLVIRLGTTWLCDIKYVAVVVVWTYGRRVSCNILCCATMSCDQDRKPPNVGPLQNKFLRHNGRTKMLCAIWRNLNIFLSFFTLQSRQIYKKIVNVWTLVAQLFAWPRHVLCRTTLLYKVVRLNCCPCGRAFIPNQFIVKRSTIP